MKSFPIIDLHQDISYYYVSGASGLTFKLGDFDVDMPGRHGDIPKFREANVRIIFSSVFCLLSTISPRIKEQLKRGYAVELRAWTPKATHTTALEHIKVYYKLAKMYPDDIVLISTRDDIDTAIRGDKIGFLLALEGTYMLEDLDDLQLYYNLGIRSIQLTWNFDTRYAASCMSAKDYGLTGEGEELIREANRLGMIIDLAHASKRTHLEAAEISKLPLINSHVNPKKIHDIPRNLDDEMYEAIKKTGGVVGFMCDLLGKKKDIETYADSIMYVYETFGPDILAIGTDYFGLIDSAPPRGLEDITKFRNLFNLLAKKGMSQTDIEKLAYKNALRVILEHAKNWKTKIP
ncbi:MAG: hypothetical protein DRN65_01300 [Thaumarchaeota archaeon]|nr:MAG: hypothetical protein DRN65_01300 [Nitrososphaerota archaeon]